MATTIKLKNSVTTTNAPSSLVQGEVAINITDKKVWVGNAAGTPIQLLGAGGSASFGALTCTSLTNSGLTSGRVTYATTAGLLTDSAGLTFDGTNFATTGTATATRFIPSGSTVATNGMYLPAANSIGISTNSTNAIYIDSSQNVGIGVSSPGQKLDVSTTGDIQLRLGNAATGAQFTYDIGRVAATGLLQFYGNQSGATGYIFSGVNGERMRIDSSGNVLIGNSTDALGGNRLLVQSAATANNNRTFSVYNTAATSTTAFANRIVQISSYGSGADATIHFSDQVANNAYFGMGSGALYFATGGTTERMRITSGGYVKASNDGNYVSTSAAYHELRNTASDWVLYARNTAASNPYCMRANYSGAAPNNTGNQFLYCDDTSSLRAEIRSNGGLANYSANNSNLSDRREKTNFAPAKNYLDIICAIPVQTFNYIDQNLEEDDGLTLGVVAQDVQAVAPELVTESNWGTQEEPKMRLSIYQTDLQYALMKCIQEQQAMIEELKQEVALLKSK